MTPRLGDLGSKISPSTQSLTALFLPKRLSVQTSTRLYVKTEPRLTPYCKVASKPAPYPLYQSGSQPSVSGSEDSPEIRWLSLGTSQKVGQLQNQQLQLARAWWLVSITFNQAEKANDESLTNHMGSSPPNWIYRSSEHTQPFLVLIGVLSTQPFLVSTTCCLFPLLGLPIRSTSLGKGGAK